ncbi:hypothetical protein WJX72_002175 [[Myrmecia] bisecta]|uniref:Uncharacterized protein n=1 Tax=[Myrmecia] bisecta TaxID=41462 RepID=A0AAW1Q228_9CHLO
MPRSRRSLQGLGDYGYKGKIQMLCAKRQEAGRADPDSAMLRGIRLLFAEEPDEGARLNINLLKDWSGGGALSFRLLFSNEVDEKMVDGVKRRSSWWGWRLRELPREEEAEDEEVTDPTWASSASSLQHYLGGSPDHPQEHIDHGPASGEALDLDEHFVQVQGVYEYSKSGKPTAADLKAGLRRFLTGGK